jgi:two-component system LytT family sensor kinase
VQEHIVTLLVKIGLIASIASFGVRSSTVRSLLLREVRTVPQRLQLALWFIAMFLPGVVARVANPSYTALDLGFEGSLLAGIAGGYVTGMVAGMTIAVPSMFAGEFLSLPVFAIIGLSGGLLRDSASDENDIWRFSPFPDINVYRVFAGVLHRQPGRDLRSALFHAYATVGVLASEFVRETLGTAFRGRLFTLGHWGDPPSLLIALYATTYLCITLPLKVWSSTRNEFKLEEQQRLLMQARLDALASQINPHFLFNTLNSVASLIRLNPEQARTMVVRLSRILRKRLRNQDHFTALGDELEFIDDYLAIETARFGEKLRVVKEIDPTAAAIPVPSMLLQPLVENSIRHGLASKVEGGTVTLRARRGSSRLFIEVEDDGVGIPESEMSHVLNKGIGVSNVKERLEVLYNQDYRMDIDSQPGRGTRIEIEVPEVLAGQTKP